MTQRPKILGTLAGYLLIGAVCFGSVMLADRIVDHLSRQAEPRPGNFQVFWTGILTYPDGNQTLHEYEWRTAQEPELRGQSYVFRDLAGLEVMVPESQAIVREEATK